MRSIAPTNYETDFHAGAAESRGKINFILYETQFLAKHKIILYYFVGIFCYIYFYFLVVNNKITDNNEFILAVSKVGWTIVSKRQLANKVVVKCR